MTRCRRCRTGFGSLTAMTATAIVAVAAAGCGGASSQGGNTQGSVHQSSAPPLATPAVPLAPIADYRNAVTIALADHLQVWIEADMVKRWEEGPASFEAAVNRVAALADRPGVVGIKIADELGYNDGMNSAAKIRKFLSATASALHSAAPGKLLLVDMLVPQLGCMPGHQPVGSAPARCSASARAEYPQLSLPDVDSYLRMRVIDVLDLSTDMQADSTYTAWATTADAAQADAWREVNDLGWPALVRLQARKALAGPGGFQGTESVAAADVTEFIDIPLHSGAHAVDIWTWHQEYDGQMYQLINTGKQPNALWSKLVQLRRNGDVLFTHMSPHSVETSVRSDLAQIATVFTDVFLPAGTG